MHLNAYGHQTKAERATVIDSNDDCIISHGDGLFVLLDIVFSLFCVRVKVG